jgi:hypothetical protein
MRVKTKLIRGQFFFFNWRVKLNWKIALTKGKKNQKNEGQIEKNKTTKNLIEWWNWNTKKTLTKGSRKKN